MRIDILTLFPKMFSALDESILGRATKNAKLEINVINIRDFSKDKHKKCDDYTYGGGEGMLMMVQPIYDAMTSIEGYQDALKIYLSPKGTPLCQQKVKQLSQNQHIILLCGHYEGVDQRAIEMLIDEEISIGDYVLTGGELPAMVLVDSVARLLPEVLGNSSSAEIETFNNNMLEFPQYTKPREFMGHEVPEVLISGDHKKVEKWRREQSERLTQQRRPDLLKKDKE